MSVGDNNDNSYYGGASAMTLGNVSLGGGGGGGPWYTGYANYAGAQTVTVTAPFTATTGTTYTLGPWASAPANPTMTLDGENADVVINGVSIVKTLEDIQSHLGILKPDPALEAEFEELKALGDKYRATQKKFLEQKKIFEILKKVDK